MKKPLLIFFLFTGMNIAGYSQVPQSINYQTIVRSSAGQPVAEQTVSLKFSIRFDAISGPVLYEETHVKPTNQYGLINLHIGKGTVISGNFGSIDWGSGRMFLNTQLDISGGGNFVEMGTSEMVSVPYALFAGSIFVNYSNDTLYIGDQKVYLPSNGGTDHGNTVTDFNGNIYFTVKIGTQTWLAENLKSTHYADGTPISGVYDYNDNPAMSDSYGKLYTWYAAMRGTDANDIVPSGVQGACPAGYHLPSLSEWNTLLDYVSTHYQIGGGLIGQKLKESGTAHWNTDNGNNDTGFTARGAGMMFWVGQEYAFQFLKDRTFFWSTTQRSNIENEAMRLIMYDTGVSVTSAGTIKESGISVRCIKN